MSSPQGGGSPPADAPVANFSASDYNPQPGETVYFTDESTNNPTSWTWKMDTETFSFDQNPMIYIPTDGAAGGAHTVSLTATNQFGSNTTNQTIYYPGSP